MTHAETPAPELIDTTWQLPEDGNELRGGLGVFVNKDSEAGLALDLAWRVAITDWLMYVLPIGLSGSIRYGEGRQTVFAAAITGFGFDASRALTMSAWRITHEQRVSGCASLVLQGEASLLTMGTDVQSGPMGGSLTMQWQPHGLVLVSLGAGLTHERGLPASWAGVVSTSTPLFGPPTGPRQVVSIGAVAGRPVALQPLLQVLVTPELSLYLNSTVGIALDDGVSGTQVVHRHVFGVSWTYGIARY